MGTLRPCDRSQCRDGGRVVTSLVIETWNIGGDVRALGELLALLAPQVATQDAEVVITHAGIADGDRERLTVDLGRAIRWVELPREAGYYEHKNRGFDACTRDVVAFIDGDCMPEATWLAALVAPFGAGAQVVAGATSYPGTLAPLANTLDFPYFAGTENRTFGATTSRPSATVRNFFANNVAFGRAAFAPRRYPTIEPMFHGQCQVLALQLGEAGIPIAFASGALVTHAWPESAKEWLEVRLLRGADTTQLLPHVIAHYAPIAAPAARRLGPLPALGLLAVRAVTSTVTALRHGPRMRGLALVAAVTTLDLVGAVAARAVYRLHAASGVAARAGKADPRQRWVA